MKKLLISLLAGLSLLGSVAYAQVSSNYWKLQGTTLSPLSSSWTVNTGGASATSTFGFITATTTNATSTFAGNVKIDGDLQVLGNFYAPVSIVSGGNILLRFQDVLQSLDSLATVRNLITIGGSDHVEVGDTALDTDINAVGLLSFLSPISYVNGKLGVATSTPDIEFVVEGQSLFTSTSTFLGNLLAETAQARSSAGFQLLNSQGTLVGTFGAANTTNTSFAGALAIGGALTGVTTLTTTGTTTLATTGGNVGVGTTTPVSKLHVEAPNTAITSGVLGQTTLTLQTTSAQGTDVGASIGMGGLTDASGGRRNFGVIAARKENNSSGSTSGYLSLYTHASSVGLSEKMRITSGGNIGIGTTTPGSLLSLASGSIAVSENTLATSTNMTIDFTNGNTQLIRMGTSATTIGFSNNAPGAVVKLVICNPAGGSAGAITWSGVTWSGGTIPTQTTSANKCDVWSFLSTNATSTLRIFGSASTNF